MRTAFGVAQIRAAEAAELSRLQKAGLSADTLMQRAAHGLAHAVIDFLGAAYGRRVRLLVGSGDNGGDTLYAGALLSRRGALVEAALVSPGRVHRAGLAAFRAAGGRLWRPDGTRRAAGSAPSHDPRRPVDLVLDGVVGIGAHGGLRPATDAAIAQSLRDCPGVPVVAVDVPSGVDVDSGEIHGSYLPADLTVTFGAYKAAHLIDPAALACGAV
ncbi:MAG: NAD(P)H-hydrate epimerase, partial [Nocardioides sp.]